MTDSTAAPNHSAPNHTAFDRPAPDRSAQRQRLARTLLALGFVGLGLWIAAPFLRALVWGAIVAIAVAPVYARAAARWPHHARGLLPAAITFGIALAVLVPLAAGVVEGAREAQQLTGWLKSARHDGIPLPAWVARLPAGREGVTTWWQETLATPDEAATALDRLNAAALSHSRLFGADLLRRLVAFAFALLTLFFLLRDGETIAAQTRIAGHRLFGASGERVAEQVLLSVRGTINGLVLVGLGEGAVMTAAYVAVGVPHPLLIGGLTAVAAAIPMGAAVVIGVAGLLLAATGATVAAVALAVAGWTFVVVIDHTVRPALIGGTTKLPFVWVLVGILGGVEALGLIGLFVGPATMAVLHMLWREFVGEGAAART